MNRVEEVVMDRFWAKVVKKENGCWEWTASKKGSVSANTKGYGGFTYKGVFYLAHRFSAYMHGILPSLKFGGYNADVVMHTCDNSLCVNPAHLKIGTQKDNIKDRDVKGRRPLYHGRPAKGEKHGGARLKVEDVKDIRWLLSLNIASREIANAFGMESSTISKIGQRKLWASVE